MTEGFQTGDFHTIELSDPEFERDGLRQATVKSRALSRRADVSFWVPQAERIGTLLILLHGVWGSHWVWSQKGGVHQTAQSLLSAGTIEPMVLAMPSDGLLRDGSGYLTWPGSGPGSGPSADDVERWIVEEVPALARLAAPAIEADARIGIAGLSMGGYGALRLGAKYAKRFGAISAHSSITEVDDLRGFVEEPVAEYLACGAREELKAVYWLKKHAGMLPPLRFDCGVEDGLIGSNRRLHVELEAAGIAHSYSEHAGGHDWPYWQRQVEETLLHTDRACRKQTL